MDKKKTGSQSHILLLTGTSISWAAIPFLLRGLNIEVAVATSSILFITSAAAYLIVRKLCTATSGPNAMRCCHSTDRVLE
jgi:hypothetical protein